MAWDTRAVYNFASTLPPFPVSGVVPVSLKSSEKSRVVWEVRAAGDIDDLRMATKNRGEEENRTVNRMRVGDTRISRRCDPRVTGSARHCSQPS